MDKVVEPPGTFRELLERYQSGERDFAGSNLDEDPNNDMSGECLDQADLSESFIVANFCDASLRNVRFVRANVKTCDFRDADLRGADFSGAALCSTNFLGAILDDTRFGGAFAHSHVFKDGEKPWW